MTSQQAQAWAQGKRPLFGDARWLHVRAVMQLAAAVAEERASCNWRCPVGCIDEAELIEELLLWRGCEKEEKP